MIHLILRDSARVTHDGRIFDSNDLFGAGDEIAEKEPNQFDIFQTLLVPPLRYDETTDESVGTDMSTT